MQTLLIILIILASILLAFLVLIQNPKGGGLASGFAGGANLMGVKRTGDILEKGTWIMVIAIMVFSLIVNVLGPSSGSGGTGLSDKINSTAPVTSPLSPTETPTAAPQETPSNSDTAQ
ncbi:preprotein translocase subunit SecG [Parapedobacter defluvii]|uniref:Protein-export membrane protein SecG n=1 Tax=Parapedobacter defluvii TaxID=2045106 RepID=A0ABQ1LN65_9SPHI|nr:preprotein translocase subunit SecG [Parapedobacter defluvii]RQP15548.1 MAG: preprotein translocase subunit SecG [Parapedobacter sp.]GGC24625.1 preprotein translocase subunit SecG [Parapedobacter defluvii]